MKIKSYLITDPKFFGSSPDILEATLRKTIEKHQPDLICLRDKETKGYRALAEAFMRLSGKHKTILHADIDLAASMGAFGVHLTSGQYNEIDRAKEMGLYVIASTHSYEEARIAEGADAITYSPIFYSPNKGEPKGLADLKEITGKIKTNIFALGGITTQEQIQQVQTCGVYGFASIRYFTI